MTQIPYLDKHIGAISGCSGRGCKVRAAHPCWAERYIKWRPAIHSTKKIIYGHMAGPVDIETIPHPFNQVQFHPDRLGKPLHWRKPRRIGMNFMGDWMDDQVELTWIDQILEVIAACPQHQFFSLTKQPQNLEAKIYGFDEECPARELGGGDYLPNLWNGISITDQEDVDTKIPLRIPGKWWISIEPMLSEIDISYYLNGGPEMDDYHEWHQTFEPPSWVVLGSESGPKRRPCPIENIIDVVRQCKAAGVKCWVKQIDLNGKVERDINKFPTELRVRQI